MRMELSERDLDEFIDCCRLEFGQELPRELACEVAQRLLALYRRMAEHRALQTHSNSSTAGRQTDTPHQWRFIKRPEPT